MSTLQVKPSYEELIENNIGLAEKMASRRAIPGRVEFDDLKQICCMSLMKAARTFDPSKGFAFSTYTCRIMTNDINNHLQSLRSYFESEVYAEEQAATSEYSTIEEQVESSVLISHLRTVLSPEEFDVLYLQHVEGLSQSEIAKRIGSRQPQICRISKRAVDKARNALGGEYIC